MKGTIVPGHANDKISEVIRDAGPAVLAAVSAPIVLAGDKFLVPAEQGIRRKGTADVTQDFTSELLAKDC